MKTLRHVMTRRDRCYVFARRGLRLTPSQAAKAWFHLSTQLEAMAELDVPKFNTLLIAYRAATVSSRKSRHNPRQPFAS